MCSAYILMRARPGKSKEVLEAVSKIKGVKLAHVVTGPFDVIAYVEVADMEDLSNLVLTKIHAIEGIESTQTAVVAFPIVRRAAKPRVYKHPPPPKELVESLAKEAVAKKPELAEKPLELLKMIRAAVKERGYRSAVAPAQIRAILRRMKGG